MIKVVIINHEPLTPNIKQTFFMDELKREGLYTEYWCIRKLKKINIELTDELSEGIDFFDIKNIKELKKKIEEEDLNNTVFIINIRFEWGSRNIYKTFSDYKCNTASINMYTAVDLPTKYKLLNLKYFGYKKLPKFIKSKLSNILLNLYFKLNKVKSVDYSFYCGEKFLDNNNKIIPINNFDYEAFLNGSDEEPLLRENYCVFIDQYLPYHPDFIIHKNKTLNAETYYRKLNDFFTEVEKKFNTKVVIAAHPKSDYHRYNIFGSFHIYKYATDKLIKNCDFVLLHDSLAMSFGVLYQKPLLFFYTNEFCNTGFSTLARLKYFSNFLGSSSYNIDDSLEIKINKIDKNKYDKYKYSYLTTRYTENKRSYKVIADYIKDRDRF